ncbi:hypothetical protein LguiB_013415 [Lonicera macranthoides]
MDQLRDCRERWKKRATSVEIAAIVSKVSNKKEKKEKEGGRTTSKRIDDAHEKDLAKLTMLLFPITNHVIRDMYLNGPHGLDHHNNNPNRPSVTRKEISPHTVEFREQASRTYHANVND